MLYVYTGSKKWEGGACAGGPHHIPAKNGTSRSCYAADRGELWQQGRNTTLPIPVVADDTSGRR